MNETKEKAKEPESGELSEESLKEEEKPAKRGEDEETLPAPEQALQKAREEIRALKIQLLSGAGAADAVYLLEKIGDDVSGKELVKKAKETFPALFYREVQGVRPMAAEKEAEAPLSFSGRLKLFSEDPQQYRSAYGKR